MHKTKWLYLTLLLLIIAPIKGDSQVLEKIFGSKKSEQKQEKISTPQRDFDYMKWRKTRDLPQTVSYMDYIGSTLDNIWSFLLENEYIPIIYLDAPKGEQVAVSEHFSFAEYAQHVAEEEDEQETELLEIEDIPIVEDGEFSPIPTQYKIWSTDAIDPYNVDLTNLEDTLKIDVSSYVSPGYKYVTSEFGWRRSRMHYGIDLKVYTGDTIRSAFADGVVRIKRFNRRGYGHYVVIRHANGVETLYGHLSKPLVNEGDTLKAGDIIGLGGSTGRSSGAHLHFEIRYLGKAINPKDAIDFENDKVRRNTLVLTKKNFIYGRKSKNSAKSGGSKSSSSPSTVTVRKGDTLGSIAKRYGTTVAKIKKLNGLKSNNIKAGKRLRIR